MSGQPEGVPPQQPFAPQPLPPQPGQPVAPQGWAPQPGQPGWGTPPAQSSDAVKAIIVGVVAVGFIVVLLGIAALMALLFLSGSITQTLSQIGDQL
jgi:hypothetical protein